MVEVPERVSMETLVEWDATKKQLSQLKMKEALLRKAIFESFFPAPVEGTNKFPLNGGWLLKADYPIERKVDPTSLDLNKERLREIGIPVDDLIRYKPELSKRPYNKLTDEQRTEFDEVLIIKPGSPQLEIVLPASAQAKDG